MTLQEDCSLEALLAYAAREDVRLSTYGGKLRYDAPAHSAGPGLEGALRRHKAALLARLRDEDAPDAAVLDEETVEERELAGTEQRGMVMRHEVTKEPQVWNVALRVRLEGPLDTAALEGALEKLIHRHQSLRCRFVWKTDTEAQPPVRRLWQEVLAPRPVPLPVEDISGLPPQKREERLEAACATASATPFDMARGVRPLVRLLRTGPESSTLMLVLHHVSCDGWSVSVLLRDLGRLYRDAVGQGPPEPLAPPTAQCTDYARLQASTGPDEREYRRRLDYWARQLADCPTDNPLPADNPRPAELSGRGGISQTDVPPELFAALRHFARDSGTTPFAVTLAALATMLHQRTGREELVVTSAYANRAHPSTETMVTCTSAVLALRLRPGKDGTLSGLCRQVMTGLAGGIANFLTYRQIKEGLARHHGLRLPDVLPLSMTYQNSLDLRLDLPGITATVTDQAAAASRRESTFGLVPHPDGTAHLYTEYSTDLFHPETAQAWLTDYISTLTRLLPGG